MADQQARFREAQRAIRRGDRREARALLSQALKENPQDFRIWLLMAGAAGSPRASLDYIARAERLQPGHPTIARARAWAEKRLAASGSAAEAPEPGAGVGQAAATLGATPAAAGRARRRHVVARAALFAFFMLLVAVVTGWAWSQRPQTRQPAGAVAQAVTTTPTSVKAVATEAATVIRGQFLPRSVAAATATPEATGTPLAFPVHRKVSSASSDPRPTWTVTPSPTPTATATPTVAPTFVSVSTAPQPVVRPAGVGPDERWIDVNLTQQRLVAYEGDVPVFETLVSSGTWNHPTVTGQFRVWLRFTSQTMDGRRLGYNYYLENVPYVMYFFEDYALHGTYWHNNFGTPMSHGCVNLPTPAAEWIFNWSSIGTLVNVHY
ncbi:MAG: L,D-transpeptidase family protein [Anaerolineae bacterium]|nr:L,D-transpeptidase family protein [Anaerolineae bacterium]